MGNSIENKLEELLNSEDWRARLQAAEKGCGLHKLVNDRDENVRRAVALKGFGLDKLVNDESWKVREAVARQGFGLEILINDESWVVRATVAIQGYGLDKLINDKNWVVRKEVAYQGFGLDKLVNDEYTDVRNVAISLMGSKTVIVERNFGTYNGILYLRIWKNKYRIESNFYNSSSIDEWHEKCTEQINKETADLYYKKMKELLKGLI